MAPEQHIETAKAVLVLGDIASAGALVMYWLGLLSGFMVPLGSIAGSLWFIFRAVDMYWTLRDRWKQRKEMRREDQ